MSNSWLSKTVTILSSVIQTSTSSTRQRATRIQICTTTAIISSAYDSQYGHPHDEVLEDFADRRIEIYWTAVHGDVVLTTDGNDVSLETEHEFSTDATGLLDEKSDDDTEASRITTSRAAQDYTRVRYRRHAFALQEWIRRRC